MTFLVKLPVFLINSKSKQIEFIFGQVSRYKKVLLMQTRWIPNMVNSMYCWLKNPVTQIASFFIPCYSIHSTELLSFHSTFLTLTNWINYSVHDKLWICWHEHDCKATLYMCCKTRGRNTVLGCSRRCAAVRRRGKLRPDLDLRFPGTDVNLLWGCYRGNY